MNNKFILFWPVTESENLKTAERITHRGNWAEVDVCLIVLEFVVVLFCCWILKYFYHMQFYTQVDPVYMEVIFLINWKHFSSKCKIENMFVMWYFLRTQNILGDKMTPLKDWQYSYLVSLGDQEISSMCVICFRM